MKSWWDLPIWGLKRFQIVLLFWPVLVCGWMNYGEGLLTTNHIYYVKNYGDMRRYMHQYDIQFLLWHHATLLKSVYLDAWDIHNLISCMVMSIEYKWEYKCINIPLLLIILLEFSLFYWFLYSLSWVPHLYDPVL